VNAHGYSPRSSDQSHAGIIEYMLPLYQDIELPLLRELLLRGGASRPGDCRNGKNVYEALGEHFSLTKEDYEAEVIEPKTGAHRSKWENMVRFARRRCVDRGQIDNLTHGVWALTADGERDARRA
jgi:hypothetical protein